MPFKSRAQKEYLRINEPEIYERWMREYHAESNQSFTPPATAVAAAKKGLAQRKKWGRGGLSPAEAASQGIDSGVTRARKISSGKVSRHDVRRMSAFNRHRKNNNPSKKMPDGGPTAGTIAWNLWGGSSGVNWAKKKSAAMNAEDFEMMCRQCKIGNYESCLYGETVDTGGFWLSNCVPDPSMNAETFNALSPICKRCGLSEAGSHQLDPTGETGICIICTFNQKMGLNAEGRFSAEKYYEEDPERYYSSQFEPYDSFPTKDSAEQLYIKTKDFINTWSEGWDDYRTANQENGGYFTSLNAVKKDANKEAKYYARKGYFPFYQSEDSSGINFTCQKSEDGKRTYNRAFNTYSEPLKDYTERVEIKYELIEKMGAETFDAESWSPKKSMKQWMQHEEQTEEEVTWGYFHANLYPPNKLLTKIWTFEGKPNGSVEAWWNTITNQDDDEQQGQLEEVFERHYSIILKSARKDVQQLIEEHNWYDMMSAETFESPVSCKICGKTFDSFRGLNGHMNAHLPSHRKRAEDEEEEDELRTYEVSVPVLHYYGIGPVEAYDEDEAADEVRNNWGYWRRTIQDNGDWGGPLWRYSPLTSGEPEAYEIFDSETFGDVDSDGQLAQALARARAKSQEPRRPLKITKLPHRDQTSLKDFEAQSSGLNKKDLTLLGVGAVIGVVSGVLGEVLAEFVLDRYRRRPELISDGSEENA